MFCPKCGAEMPDNSLFCAQCGTSMNEAQQPTYQEPPYQQPIPPQYAYPQQDQMPQGRPINGTTYLIISIVVTLFCCIPAGIPAIVYAAKIDKAQAMNDYAGAEEAAKKAKMWMIITAVLGVLACIAMLVFSVSFTGMAMNSAFLY